MRESIFLAAAAALIITPAWATTPKISGKYVVNYNEICQQNDPDIQFASQGQTNTETLLANFNSTSGTVKLSGSVTYGPLVGSYVALATTPMSENTTYSNTATTVTIGSTTFNVLYGPLKNGIAQSAVFSGVSSGLCAASATAIHQ
jgi:surface antigen